MTVQASLTKGRRVWSVSEGDPIVGRKLDSIKDQVLDWPVDSKRSHPGLFMDAAGVKAAWARAATDPELMKLLTAPEQRWAWATSAPGDHRVAPEAGRTADSGGEGQSRRTPARATRLPGRLRRDARRHRGNRPVRRADRHGLGDAGGEGALPRQMAHLAYSWPIRSAGRSSAATTPATRT